MVLLVKLLSYSILDVEHEVPAESGLLDGESRCGDTLAEVGLRMGVGLAILLLQGKLVLACLHGAADGLAGALHMAAGDRFVLALCARGWVPIVREEFVLSLISDFSIVEQGPPSQRVLRA